MSYVFRVTCQVSHVRCHMSLVMCPLSHFFSWWSVCYQQGLLRLVFRLFGNKNVLIPNIYLSRLVVVRSGSLKKANWWEFNFRDIGIGLECQTLQIYTRAHAAPCAHFQKLDIGITQLRFVSFHLGSLVAFLWLNLITKFLTIQSKL